MYRREAAGEPVITLSIIKLATYAWVVMTLNEKAK
jgi:hypothetical protein